MDYLQDHIRNFAITAHIDHGKTTLSDRILEMTGAVQERELSTQMLDDLPLEQRRGITVKLNAVNLDYKAKNGEHYLFNLIDTPGHVDFTYEVSRSLSCCEGAILLVDATQGVQAQTLANAYLALDDNLKLLPVINKVDLATADPEMCKEDLIETLNIDPDDCMMVSAKTGLGVGDLLEAIVQRLPAPKGDRNKPLKAMIFDSKFDPYRGVVILLKIEEGSVKLGDRVKMMSNPDETYVVQELGFRTPKEQKRNVLSAGEVGYLCAQIKDIKKVKVGDTLTNADVPASKPLDGFRPMMPMVYSGLYPTDNKNFEKLREALEKLSLNDAALVYEPETSVALGSGFRCGFLGLLHMSVVQERLEEDYDLDLICTAPSVVYDITLTNGKQMLIQNPSDFPSDPSLIKKASEPFVKAEIMTPQDYVGPLMQLCESRRGEYQGMDYIDTKRVSLKYILPLSEVIFSFFDRLKSLSAGYASLDYQPIGYRDSKLARMDILLNNEKIDALTTVVFRDTAYPKARAIVDKLKDVIPRQQFEIPVQAAIDSKVIARSDIKAVRKDVLAKCYGGDISRKKKLLEKQKEGKKRMKEFGKVYVPQEAFIAVLSVDPTDVKK